MALLKELFTSIQARLLGVFLVITLLTVVIVIAFNQWLRVQLIAEADNALLVSAVQIADRIDEFNRSNKQLFNVGARLPDLVGFLQADETQRNDFEFRERTLITLDSLEIEPWDEYYVLSQAILDGNGLNILDTERSNIGTSEAEQGYVRAALLGGAINISPLQYRPDRSGIYFYYAVPLRESTPPNSVIGVLRVQVSIASIQNIVFKSTRGHDLGVTVFDPNYIRVVDTQHEKLLFRSIATFSPEELTLLRDQYAVPPLSDQEVSLPIPSLVDILSNTRQNHVVSSYITPNAESEDRIAVVKLETVPWYLVVSQPTAKHYQSVQQQSTGILVLAFSLTLVALIASYFISKRITEPIRTLTAVAKQVAEGELHIKAPITSGDEVGILAKTFNQMTTELELAHATLEDRVKRRTQELMETNEKLKHEIIERERYEKQALELALEHERRRILSEFIQNASHEFKTPLSIINVSSHLAKQFLPVEQHRHIQAITEQSQYIDGLISRMVLMSRLDSGVATSLEYLYLDEFVRSVYTSFTDTFERNQVTTLLDLQAENTWIQADPEFLFIAIQNIMDNALKYSHHPIKISLKTCIQNDMAVIIIQDNGVGFSDELKPHIFEHFYRADVAHTTRGFGLGLTIAKRIIESIQGTIELESAVDKGTTVTMKLWIASKK